MYTGRILVLLAPKYSCGLFHTTIKKMLSSAAAAGYSMGGDNIIIVS